MRRPTLTAAILILASCIVVFGLLSSLRRPGAALASANYQPLPFFQDWSMSSLITLNDDWSGVPGIVGYNGSSSGVNAVAVDPQTVLTDTVIPADIEVAANLIAPSSNVTDTVAAFVAHPSVENNAVVGLRPQTAHPAPFLLVHIDSTGMQNIRVQYNVRDIDASGRDSVQPVALQYRIGESGNFTNVPGGFIADATMGVTATLVTAVDVTLPADANNQPMVQLRMLTTNALGADEWVGIDDISVTGDALGPSVTETPSSTPTTTQTDTPTSTPTATPTSTPSPTPTSTFTPTPTPSPSPTPSATSTGTSSGSSTPSPSASSTLTASPTPTPSPTRPVSAGPVRLFLPGVIVPARVTLTPTPSATAPAASVLVLDNYSYYVDSIQYLHVVGEVLNNTSNPIRFVKVTVNFFNASGALVANSFSYIYLDNLPAGEKSCFSVLLAEPAGWTSYQFESPAYSTSSEGLPSGLTVLSPSGTYDSQFGWYSIIGQVRNDAGTTVKYVQPVGTLYNAQGKVVGCGFTYVNSTDLTPSQSSSFTITFVGRDYADVSTWRLQVDGDPQ